MHTAVVAVLKIAKVIAFITQKRSHTKGAKYNVPQKTILSWKSRVHSIQVVIRSPTFRFIMPPLIAVSINDKPPAHLD